MHHFQQHYIPHKLNNWRTKTLLSLTKAKRKNIWLLLGCSEVNNTCVVYTNHVYVFQVAQCFSVWYILILFTVKTRQAFLITFSFIIRFPKNEESSYLN